MPSAGKESFAQFEAALKKVRDDYGKKVVDSNKACAKKLDAAAGEHDVHRRAQPVAQDKRRPAQLLGRHDPGRSRSRSGNQHHFLLGQTRRHDQAAA